MADIDFVGQTVFIHFLTSNSKNNFIQARVVQQNTLGLKVDRIISPANIPVFVPWSAIKMISER